MTRPSSRTIPRRPGALALVALATLVACGDDDDTDAPEPAGTEAPGRTQDAAEVTAPVTPPGDDATTTLPASDYPLPADSGDAAAAGDGVTVAVAESSLGSILVDGAGMTLYVFVPDEQGPSTCVDACLEAWPALPGPAAAGEGVDETLLGTAPRPEDGSAQATCAGWPLYTFVQDAAPGDVNGQGANDVWFVLDPACTPIGR